MAWTTPFAFDRTYEGLKPALVGVVKADWNPL